MDIQIILFILFNIVFVMVLGGICALFSYLLDYCIWPGSIFGKYLPWLSETLLKQQYPDEWKEVTLLPKQDQENHFIERAGKIFFFKILGGCIICTNIWIGFISWIAIELFSAFSFNWLYAFPYILTSSTILRKLLKH